MTTQSKRLNALKMTFASICLFYDNGMIEKIPTGDIGAIYKNRETGTFHVLGLDEAKNFQPDENCICLKSAPRIKKGDQRLRAPAVTKAADYDLTAADRAEFVQMASAIRGPYAGKHHDETSGDFTTTAWVVDAEGNESYVNEFVDATVMKDNTGAPLLLLLLGNGTDQPVLRAIDIDGKDRPVKLVGKVEEFKTLQAQSLARPEVIEGITYLAVNAAEDKMALIEVQHVDGDQLKFVVTSVVGEKGEVQVTKGDQQIGVKALIGRNQAGTYGVFTKDGDPLSLNDVETATLMQSLANAQTQQATAV